MESKKWIELPSDSQEIIREGWEYTDGTYEWHLVSSSVGMTVQVATKRYGCGWRWRKPTTPKNDWIPMTEQKPTKEDSQDGTGYVVGLRSEGGGIGFFRYDDIKPSYDFWKPLHFTPPPSPKVVVNGHEVIPNKDGSLTIGCTTVPCADMEEIIRQRREAMLK